MIAELLVHSINALDWLPESRCGYLFCKIAENEYLKIKTFFK